MRVRRVGWRDWESEVVWENDDRKGAASGAGRYTAYT